MKLALRNLLESADGLRALGALPLRPSVAHRITRALRFFREHAEDYETERQKLVQQYAQKDDAGKVKTVNVKEDGRSVVSILLNEPEKFNAAIVELRKVEIEVPATLKTIKLSEFDCAIQPGWLEWLEWLVVEDDADSKPKPE